MALARSRRGDSGMNYWPGFVDALSTLILSIIFILTVFVVVQFYLQQEIAGKDAALGQLNVQIAQLTDLLSMEKSNKINLENQRPAQYIFSAEVQKRLSDIRRDEALAAQQKASTAA